ncbi:MAG: amidohydrolase family protein [Anaerocolumna sp.]
MKKILIKNGNIVDGTGRKAYKGDILFCDSILKIASHIDETTADEVYDVPGLTVAPGFIDPHSHADLSVIEEKRQSFAVCQGVTTQVVGLCGLGFVPLPKDRMIETMEYSAGLFGYKPAYNNYDLSSFDSYMRLAEKAATNVAVSATHNAARVAAAGYTNHPGEKEKRTEIMKQIIEDAMDAGCIGISTGLSYYPCAHADYEELKEIAETVKKRNGTFLMHIRYPKPEEPYGALKEIIRLGLEAKARIHILHYRTKYPLDYGHPEVLIDMFEKANREGGDFTLETLPYLSGSTFIHTILPAWVVEGGIKPTLRRLKDPGLRPRIIKEMQYLLRITALGNGKPPRFGHVGGHTEYSGKFIRDVAEMRRQSIDEMLLDLMIESRLDINYVGNEAEEDPEVAKILMNDTMTLLRNPLYLVGSDAMPYGEYPHPRTYGCYARMLRLSREQNIPVEEVIAKITSAPAKRLSIPDRGELLVNRAADIVVFDTEKIRDNADFDNPVKAPSGIRYVFVNGVLAVEDGVQKENYSGHVLRKK